MNPLSLLREFQGRTRKVGDNVVFSICQNKNGRNNYDRYKVIIDFALSFVWVEIEIEIHLITAIIILRV